MKYIVYPANISMGYKPKEFTSLAAMNRYLNAAIRRGEILTVKAVKK